MAYGLPGTWEAPGILDVAEKLGLAAVPLLVNVAGGGALHVVLSAAAPPLFNEAMAAATSALKSPLRSAAVGTQVETRLPRLSLFHSSFHQKKSLSFLTGPETK